MFSNQCTLYSLYILEVQLSGEILMDVMVHATFIMGHIQILLDFHKHHAAVTYKVLRILDFGVNMTWMDQL